VKTHFLDRRKHLFGRAGDIRLLQDRAMQSGITAVLGRRLMGKSWTLEDTARSLLETGSFLVGYHESNGESNHLLYAVASLYASWLSSAPMRQQALSLWQRHKSELVPRVGQLVGEVLERLGGMVVPEQVSIIVRKGFDKLAVAQKDALGGGVELSPLAYEQALSLASLVANVSKRRIVLILDAWEKSSSIPDEVRILETFVDRLEDWPETHIFLGVRTAGADEEGIRDSVGLRARALEAYRPGTVSCHELRELVLDGTEERRFLDYVRAEVPVLRSLDDATILTIVDGYPGVVSFWLDEATRARLTSVDALRQRASNAHQARYPEFSEIFAQLTPTQLRFAARLAFLPNLEETTWVLLQEPLLDSLPECVVDELMIERQDVLSHKAYPTYGHDTRHEAARAWFVFSQPRLIKSEAEKLVSHLASRIVDVSDNSALFAIVLASLTKAVEQTRIRATARALVSAARSLLRDPDMLFEQDFDDAWRCELRRDEGVAPLIAMALVNRGVERSSRGDHDGALADFEAASGIPGAGPYPIAEALLNHARLLEMSDAYERAIEDFSAVLRLPGATPSHTMYALGARARTFGKLGRGEKSIADYTAVIEHPDTDIDTRARALNNRGVGKQNKGDLDGALADFAAAIDLAGAPDYPLANALINRGRLLASRGDLGAAVSDYTRVLELMGARSEQRARALLQRGRAYRKCGHELEARADFLAIAGIPDAPSHINAQAAKEVADGSDSGRDTLGA
jgi:tetratricopeptide (TPR) repeat protein